MDTLTIFDQQQKLIVFLYDLAKKIEIIIERHDNIRNFKDATRGLNQQEEALGADSFEAKIIKIVLDELLRITAQEFECVKDGLPVAITHPESKSPEPGYILKD